MPTVLRSGPYRFFFMLGTGTSPFMSNATIAMPSSGLLRRVMIEAKGSAEKSCAKSRTLSRKMNLHLWRVGMNSSAIDTSQALATAVAVTHDTLTVDLNDGRTISVPIDWYPRLRHASLAERKRWRFIAGGQGIHWPDLDEDISVANLLGGQPSTESQKSFKNWLERRNRTKP
jgi:Protein of unknown function (DUF2442)